MAIRFIPHTDWQYRRLMELEAQERAYYAKWSAQREKAQKERKRRLQAAIKVLDEQKPQSTAIPAFYTGHLRHNAQQSWADRFIQFLNRKGIHFP